MCQLPNIFRQLLIIQNDTIQYEKYCDKYDESSIVPSFSISKSITSILIGCAIDDKLIQSVDEPIANYIPELKENGFEKVTIEHLLQMPSGLKFNEDLRYQPAESNQQNEAEIRTRKRVLNM